MGKTFTEFWKRPIAGFLALVMMFSMCSAGFPVQQAHAASDDIPVDGRIISETAMAKIEAGGQWADSFAFTADVLTEIFGTTIATVDSDPTKTINLAKDINTLSSAEENVLASFDDLIDANTFLPVTIRGNGKALQLRIVMSHLPTIADDPIVGHNPVEVGGVQYSNKVANYLTVEGTLVNRASSLSIGLGRQNSVDAFRARFDTACDVSYTTPPTGQTVGTSFNLIAQNNAYEISNLPYVGNAPYSAYDATPTLIIVPKSPIVNQKTAYVRDVTNPDDPVIVPATINYVTDKGAAYTAGADTTDNIIATATLPYGYNWAPGEDGIAEMGYWDTEAYIDVVEVTHTLNLTVVDKYDASINLPLAKLSLERKVNGNWEDCGKLNGRQFTTEQLNLIRAAANTANYEFRIVNSSAERGYNVDTSSVSLDARYSNNITKQFQEPARYRVVVFNTANDGVAMEGATYYLTYGENFSETITIGADGVGRSSVFIADGNTRFTIQQLTTVEGYIAGDTSTQTLSVGTMYDADTNSNTRNYVDNDVLYVAPDYDHYIHINVTDDLNTAVSGVRLGVYTDAACTIPAIAEDGTTITNAQLTTDASGNIVVPEVNAGTYYIKLERSTNGYTDTLFAPATSNNVAVFPVTVVDNNNTASVNIGIRRQLGDITLTVTDGNNAPVAGAVYELKAINIHPIPPAGNLNNSTVGQYTTDNNGRIVITAMNQGHANGYTLVNGTYELVLVSAPAGFRADTTSHSVDLNWVEHAETVSATVLATMTENVYNTNFSVVDKNTGASLTDAVLTLQQKVNGTWTKVDDLTGHQLTPAMVDVIKAASNTSNYEFRVINSSAAPGYTLDNSVAAIDARADVNVTKQFEESSRHIIHISNVADNNTPMAGVKYTLTYGDHVEELVLGPNGNASSTVIIADGNETIVITRSATVEDYVMDAGTQTRTINLTDMTYAAADDAYAYVIADKDIYSPPDYNHHINIHVQDDAAQIDANTYNNALAGVQVGIYVDDTCQTPAITETGAAITAAELTSDANGNIVIPEVPAGMYYIKLVKSVAAHADTLFNPATNNNVEVFTIVVEDNDTPTSLNIGVRRQVGDITLNITDEKNAPVVGAIYELVLVNAPEEYAGAELSNNIVVGQYASDNNGVIHITHMANVANIALVNGTYELNFVSAPMGYKTPAVTTHAFDLTWVEHEDIVYDNDATQIANVVYTTSFSVVDKYTDAQLPEAVLSLQQKVGENWQTVGELSNWQLTPALIDAIRAAATTANYEFRVINSAAHPGYAVDTASALLDARFDNDVNLKFQEVTQHIIHISNVADDDVPMEGAQYTIIYGDASYTVTLDEDGKATSPIFLNDGHAIVTVTRDTEVEGYEFDANTQTRTINLSDMIYSENDNAFAYNFADEDTYIPPDYNHYIEINVQDETGVPVANVQFGVYTDEDCEDAAVTEQGTAITVPELTSGADGKILVPEVPAGTYYIKLVKSTDGYTDKLFAPADNSDTAIFEISVVDDDNYAQAHIGIRRQVGDVTLTVVDEKNAPVEGAVYSLTLVNPAPNSYAGAVVDANIIVGEYTTDANGIIHITTMNNGPFAGHKLINGTYHLDFVSVPDGYKPSRTNSFALDLTWQEHENTVYETARDAIETYAVYTLNVHIQDADVSRANLYTMYTNLEDSVFESAYNDTLLSHAAYLIKGKDINMTVKNVNEIEVLIDGNIVKIAPETVLLTHKVESLDMSFTTFYYQPEGAPTPVAIDIPIGVYTVSMDDSGTGYEWVVEDTIFDAYDDDNRTITVTLKEKVITSAVSINKTDANYNTPISDITFALLHVDVLAAHGFDVTNANVTNKDITKFLADNEMTPRYEATTQTNGAADFGRVPYGTYWLVELYDNQAAKYELTNPVVVTVDGSNLALDVTNITKAAYIRIEHTDLNTNAPIANAEFALVADDVAKGTLVVDANGHAISANDYQNGTFVLTNTKVGAGYVLASPVTFTALNGVWTLNTANGSQTLVREWNADLNKWIVTVPVQAIKNTVTIRTNHDGQPLGGADITIFDADHNIVHTLNNENGVVSVQGLPAGTYHIAQTTPAGFVTVPEKTLIVDDANPTYTVVFDNEQTLVTVKTLDAIGGWELTGVVVEMYQGDTLIATFDDAHKSFVGIPVGDYILKTVTMPVGYQKPTSDIVVSVRDIADEQIFINNAIDNTQTPDDGSVVYEDNRTYGVLNIYKYDTVSNEPLANVEFSLRYAESIVIDGDPIPMGTELCKLVTDAEGKATSTKLAIAIYTEQGIAPIKYSLVETTLPAGQYVAGAASVDLQNIQIDYVDAETALVEPEAIRIGNDRPDIRVTAFSDPETRRFDENGSVNGFDFTTVLTNGDKITYTIEVTNMGTATGHDITVKDILPEEFVVVNANDGRFSQYKGNIYWHIAELEAGKTVQLILEVEVNSEYATLVENHVEWTMPEEPFAPGETLDKDDDTIEWAKEPGFEYQVIQFSGVHNQRELIVSAYDTIQFTYNFKSVAELTDLRIVDEIPEGLTFVEGSAMLNGEPTENYTYDEETGIIEFYAPEDWKNSMAFSFTVQVDHIHNGEEHEWVNFATATFLANAYKNEDMTLMTDETVILADALMAVEYDVDTMTYIGAPDDCDGATVLQKGDTVRHTIYIYNDGISSLKRIAIKDILPENATAIKVKTNNADIFETDANSAGWYIRKLAPGESIELSFDMTVKEQKAGKLINYVQYDLLDTLPTLNGNYVVLPDFKTTVRETDASVYQVIEFHKAAEVLGKENADGKVAIGDTIVYTMSVNAADFVEGIAIIDKLPAGVTLVPGSIQFKLASDVNWRNLTDVSSYDSSTRTICIDSTAEGSSAMYVEAGMNYFRFQVTVDRIGSNNANANNYNKAEFTNTATLEYWAAPGDFNNVAELKSETVSHMTEISLTGNKTGSVATYEGVYADRKNVTVVVNDDELTFNISIKNTGVNALTDVVVQDVAPENTTLITKDGDTFEQKDGTLTWIIPEIKANETATVSFTVKVAAPADKAVEIINQAKYAVPADVSNIKSSEWINTDSVVYQVISITMSSSVAGGTTAEDAKSVEIGSTITYTITVECVDDIYGLNLSNKIPAGMEYVADSAKVKIGDAAAEAAKITLDSDTIKFNQFDEVKAGKLVVAFDVKVKDTAEYDKGVTFINQADATLKANKDSDKTVALKTNPISHTTKKTNATDTPKLGVETTSASLVWGMITMVALAGICVFAYFGFIEPRKKRRN